MKSVYWLNNNVLGHLGAKVVQLLALFKVGIVNCLFSVREYVVRSEPAFIDQTEKLKKAQ